MLFIPANRLGAFDKALAGRSDIVCLGLEYAVPADQKAAARAPAIDFLLQAGHSGPQCAVRINAVTSHVGLEDLTAVLCAAPRYGMILLPKVTEVAKLRLVDQVFSEIGK